MSIEIQHKKNTYSNLRQLVHRTDYKLVYIYIYIHDWSLRRTS